MNWIVKCTNLPSSFPSPVFHFLHSHHMDLWEEIPIFVWLWKKVCVADSHQHVFEAEHTGTSDLRSLFLSPSLSRLLFTICSGLRLSACDVGSDARGVLLQKLQSSRHLFWGLHNYTACIRTTNKDKFQINDFCIISGMFIFPNLSCLFLTLKEYFVACRMFFVTLYVFFFPLSVSNGKTPLISVSPQPVFLRLCTKNTLIAAMREKPSVVYSSCSPAGWMREM